MITYRYPSSLKLVDRDAYILSLCEGAKVLHLGCTDSPVYESQWAAGRLLHPQLFSITTALCGVDIDEQALAWMKERFEGDYVAANIESDAFVSAFQARDFDVILLPDVLEHTNNPYNVLANIRRAAGDGACILVSVPNAYSLKGVLRAALRREVIHPDHVAFHSLYTLTNLLARSGWQVTESFSYLGGGKGWTAKLANAGLKVLPGLAEGVGVIARPAKA